MNTLNDFINEQLQNPVFKERYDALEPEISAIQTMIDARKESKVTQTKQEDVTGIS